MSLFELCGFAADQNGAFPVAAYYKFCKNRGIPFPIDWRPKGESEDLAPVAPVPSPESGEVVDGLTVADLRKVFDHSPALRDVVAAVAEVQAMPRDGVQKPSAETIKAKIRVKAKKNGWGTADDGSLAKTQWTGLKTIVLGRGEVGRPKKEKQKENP